MGEEHEDLMIACETAKAMWDLLTALHNTSSETSELELMQKFHECSLNSNKTMIAYLARTVDIVR